MSLFSNSKLIFLHNKLEEVPKAKSYDLLLSPQFYIVKKEELPIKYAFQAKKLAPSILEEYLGNKPYVFEVLKDKDGWLLFAYSPQEIEEFLQNCCNIDASKINEIYFADELREILRKIPIGVDSNLALTLVDNMATIVPREMIEAQKFAKFSPKVKPKKGFKFKSTSKAKDSGGSIDFGYLVASFLILLLAGAFFIEGYSYKKAQTNEYNKISQLYEKYPQLQSKLARDSIKEKYSKIEKRQRAIRDYLKDFSSLSSKRSLLDKLELTKNAIEATFSTISKQDLNRVKTLAKSANLKVVKENGNSITLQGVLK